jgi:putative component of membrane protein insertase Oxa1/YidC/SpoIIIJ protein YidD
VVTRLGRLVSSVAVSLALLGPAGAGSTRAAESAEPPPLWQPAAAAAFLLTEAPPPPPLPTAMGWNGSLADALVRGLFGTYRAVFSSQDLPVCAFSPSCSRFSQRAIDRCGFFTGALLTLDRLLRDHPLAVGHYPTQPGGHLLEDDVERYCPAAPGR